MEPTPYPDLNAVLMEMVHRQQMILEQNLLGVYLQGSFAIGDFDRHSDVDFVIVIDQELSDEQIQALQVMHDQVYRIDCSWAQHLEGSYFPRCVLRDLSRCGEQLWYLDNGCRSLIQSNHCNTVVVRWVVHHHGIALFGPAPANIVDPIPVDMLRHEIYEDIHDWGREILADPNRFDNRFYQTFIVLSYCRMLHDLQSGTVGSKRTGAEWAKANLDPCWIELIDRTWAGRPNPEISVRTPADPEDFQRTLEFVRSAIVMSGQLV